MFLNILASIRTNNFQDEHCVEKIQALWQEQEEAVKEAFAQGE
ncbi:AraC family transcriptional regulator, partial [Streptococcus suis]|nr:AraC family transcriptional regulator [Streptococcus suis]